MIRHLLDFGILLSRQVVFAFVILAGLWFLLGRVRLLDLRSGSRTISRLALLLGLILSAAFSGVGLWYLTQDGFAGEVEPLVSSLSWLFQGGNPLYHALDSPEQYSLLYGPSVFLTNGLFLRVLGPTLVSAKLASILAGVGSLLLIFGSVATSLKDRLAWLAVGASVLLYWSHGFGVYLVRPDALLVCSVAFGLFVVSRSSPRLGLIGLAAAVGFAVNLKIHGGFYFLPVLYVAAEKWGRRPVFGSLALAAILVAAPFALNSQISPGNYLAWVANASRHGLDPRELGLVLRILFLSFLPLGILLVRLSGQISLLRPYRGRVISLLAGMAPVLILASKPGAGPVHILPFVPVVIWLPVAIWRDIRPQVIARPWPRPAVAQAVVAGAVSTLVLAGAVSGYRATRLVSWQLGQEAGLADEVRGIMARFPDLDIGMACGGENASFSHTWVRPLLVFADNPLLVDPISVMDCRLAGRTLPVATHRALVAGLIDLWLVPRQEKPFQKANWYRPPRPDLPPRLPAGIRGLLH